MGTPEGDVACLLYISRTNVCAHAAPMPAHISSTRHLYIIMACIVMAYVVMADLVMTYIIIAYVVMACIVVASLL